MRKILNKILLTALTFALITSTLTLALAQTTSTPPAFEYSWSVQINGKVSNPISVTVGDMVAMPSTDVYGNIVCSGDFLIGGTWTGVPVTTLLQQAGADMSANTITFRAVDGYNVNISMSYAIANNIIIANQLDGQPLSEILRLVLPDTNGPLWIKSITEITVTNTPPTYVEPIPSSTPRPSPTVFQLPTPPPIQHVTPQPTNSSIPEPTLPPATETSLPTQAPTNAPTLLATEQVNPSAATNGNTAIEFSFVFVGLVVFATLVILLICYRRKNR